MSDYPPVRKIGIQTRSMTGTMPDGNRYESALERDLMELLRADSDFASFHAQPVEVCFPNAVPGGTSKYKPDGLVFWKSNRRPWLIEVKYRADVVGNVPEFLKKFRAAKLYAKREGWEFRILCERRIRTQRLLNVRFLHGYRSYPEDTEAALAILECVGLGASTPKEIITALARSDIGPERSISQIWRLISFEKLLIDHRHELTMTSNLWSEECSG